MGKESPANRQQMRTLIAHLAARMIAEDGISDFGLAKRKAARQAGAPDSRNLPTNVEIEDALKAYQALYQADEHPEHLHRLRCLALEMMRIFATFDPHLTGPVLSGGVGRHAEIHLHLYTDNLKELQLFLLNRDIPFRMREIKLWAGGHNIVAPVFEISTDEADYVITVLRPQDRRHPVRVSFEGRPLERARIDSVESLVAEGTA